MTRCGLGLLVAFTLAGPAPAHYFFVLSPTDGGAARLVLSDTPEADAGARVDVALGGRFSGSDSAGHVSLLVPRAGGEGWLALGEPEAAVGEVFGTVEYGVVLRGQPEPVLIVHHPRAVFPGFTANAHTDRPLEITPASKAAGIAFLVTAGGKPVVAAEVVVYAPGEKRPKVVRTGPDGLTPSFDRPGSYAARASLTEDRAGEFQGRAYKQVRHYATLTARHGTDAAARQAAAPASDR